MISSLEILTIKVGQLATNCYFLIERKSGFCLIIDPGDDGDYLLEVIRKKNLKPQKIIATHGHFDHIMGVTEIQFTLGIPFYIHQADEFLVKKMRQSAKYFLGIEAGPMPSIDGYLRDNDDLFLGKVKLKIIATPGHTPGSVSFFDGKNSLFSGDLLFAQGLKGRTDFSYSDSKCLEKSLQKLQRLINGEITVFPGHGESFDFWSWFKKNGKRKDIENIIED